MEPILGACMLNWRQYKEPKLACFPPATSITGGYLGGGLGAVITRVTSFLTLGEEIESLLFVGGRIPQQSRGPFSQA